MRTPAGLRGRLRAAAGRGGRADAAHAAEQDQPPAAGEIAGGPGVVDGPDGGDEAAAAGENGSFLAWAARLRLPGRAESRVPLHPEPPLPPHGPGQLQTADPGA